MSLDKLNSSVRKFYFKITELTIIFFSIAISYFVLGKRLGCLNIGNIPEDCQDFIDQIQDFLSSTQDILFSLPLHKVYATKAWKKLYRAQKRNYEIAMKHISDKMEEIKEKDDNLLTNDEVPEKVDFLTYMIHRGELSIEEISINALDLLGAGIDTVSDNNYYFFLF